MRTNYYTFITLFVFAGFLAGCATTPQPHSELQSAEAAVEGMVDDSDVRQYARAEMREAEQLLDEALELWQAGGEKADLTHLAELTKTRVAIAYETAAFNRMDARVDELGNQREVLRLEARAARAEREARRIEAERSRAEAEVARAEVRQVAEMAKRARAEEAAREAELQRQSEAMQRQLAQQEAREEREQRLMAERRAQELEEEAERMRERADRLQQQISELEARPTERGLVLTLGSDVLFDLDEFELREGAMRTIDRIAEFLNEYEDRQVLVEGFTDSTGARDYNLLLSERRANSVREALIVNGVEDDRISMRGYGPSYPVASNDNQAGRQLNRRVEVIISDNDEDVPERTR